MSVKSKLAVKTQELLFALVILGAGFGTRSRWRAQKRCASTGVQIDVKELPF